MNIGVKKGLFVGLLVFGVFAIGIGRGVVRMMQPLSVHENASKHLYIYPNDDFEVICDSLAGWKVLPSPMVFYVGGRILGLHDKIKPGHYEIKSGMNIKELWRKLLRGNQDPIVYRLGSVRLPEDLAAKVSRSFIFSEQELVAVLRDSSFLDSLGVNPQNVLTLFIPNSYEMWWTATPKEYVLRMAKESRLFWNSRHEDLLASGLSKQEVLVLASIVDEETRKNDEKPRIAGVYINRLRKGMRLQADPTVKFALKDFSLRRIRSVHTAFDSPYNTYKYAGLPPAPINIPSIAGIDAVLHYERHDYLFFCAKADFSGYHSFAKTFSEHQKNARNYQQELNRRQIH